MVSSPSVATLHPRKSQDCVSWRWQGMPQEALALDEQLQPLNKALFVESNPIPVKWAVSQLGLMEPHIRLPLTPYSSQHHETMRAAMLTAGVASEEIQ